MLLNILLIIQTYLDSFVLKSMLTSEELYLFTAYALQIHVEYHKHQNLNI